MLKLEVTGFSETSVIISQPTCRHIPEDSNIQLNAYNHEYHVT
jgi:hypothetical protein